MGEKRRGEGERVRGKGQRRRGKGQRVRGKGERSSLSPSPPTPEGTPSPLNLLPEEGSELPVKSEPVMGYYFQIKEGNSANLLLFL